MTEERQILTARQGSQVNSSHRLNIYSGQDAQTEDPETRNPEMLARARERIQNKENMVAEKPGGRRRRRRRVSISRSPLPADYPRAPLQDITLYLRILERTRARARPPPRQPVIHVSSQEIPEIPLQEIPEIPLQQMESAMANSASVLEETETGITNRGQETVTTTANPTLVLEIAQSQTTIQVPEDSMLLSSAQLPEQETNGLTPDLQIEEQNYAPERALSHHGNIIRDSSLTTDLGLGFYHDYHTEEARDVSMLANQKHGRAFETILLSEHSGRDRGGSRPQPQKKSSLKPLMKMR